MICRNLPDQIMIYVVPYPPPPLASPRSPRRGLFDAAPSTHARYGAGMLASWTLPGPPLPEYMALQPPLPPQPRSPQPRSLPCFRSRPRSSRTLKAPVWIRIRTVTMTRWKSSSSLLWLMMRERRRRTLRRVPTRRRLRKMRPTLRRPLRLRSYTAWA